MLSVPILGGTTAVQREEITLVGAGPKTAYELAEPILKDLSSQIFYLGPDHMTASALKLAFNIHIALLALALTEGLVFARGTGIDTPTYIKVLNSTYFKTGISERKGPRIVNDDLYCIVLSNEHGKGSRPSSAYSIYVRSNTSNYCFR